MFTKLPGDDVPVILHVVPELREMLLADDYVILGATMCEQHGLGVILVGSRKAREAEEADGGKEVVKCLVESARTLIKETFGVCVGTERVRRTEVEEP